MELTVVGVGCRKCDDLIANVQRALEAVGRSDIPIQRVQEADEIADLGVFLTPALIVDGVVWSSGRVIPAEKIAERLRRIATA